MRTSKRRSGYTLLEVSLVAAVITVVSALAYPSLQGMYGYYRVNGAVDAVKTGLAQARARAIEEGKPYRFALAPNGRRFRVAPDEPSFWSGPARPGMNGRGGALEASLPEGVTFSAQEADGQSVGADGWAAPAVFQPDGAAQEDMVLVFRAEGAQPRAVSLRAMTGAVSVRILGPGGR